LKAKVFKLKPFTDKNQKEFFKEIIAQKLEDIDEFLEQLANGWWSENVSNPLLIQMIAQIFEDDLDFDLKSANIFTIYQQITIQMIDKCTKDQKHRKILRMLLMSHRLPSFVTRLLLK
jgi:hypothetical protein